MRVQIISVPSVEATKSSATLKSGLAEAADAYYAAGLPDELAVFGVEVVGRTRPVMEVSDLSGDPIVDLGRYNAKIGGAIASGIANGAQPLMLGGTCSHLIGMLSGLQQAYGPTSRIGLVWFDAHGDFNTPRTTLSGMLGGMPVAVAAGLCHAAWREGAGQTVPLPTNRIVMVDVRNLDPEESTLIEATDVTIAHFGDDGSTDDIETKVDSLTKHVDHLYLHVDADVLDASLQPNHPTAEPNGPDLEQTNRAIATVMATGLVRAFSVVSVNPTGPDGAVSLGSGIGMIRAGVTAWAAQNARV